MNDVIVENLIRLRHAGINANEKQRGLADCTNDGRESVELALSGTDKWQSGAFAVHTRKYIIDEFLDRHRSR